MDADEPDRPEVIQGADLLLSSFQGHLRFLSQTKERWHCLLAPVMCGAAGGVAFCPGLWCRWQGLVRRKASSRGLHRSALSALTSLIITQMREEAAHYGN